ncbi:MAG: ABC transporter permease [Candidatus Wallbacteria bacterium]|nr:ABC transporter permease [Candidatus Wallbacteria bacterium]
MIRRILALVYKESLQIARDRRIRTLIVSMPITLLVIFGYGFNNEVRHLKTAVLDLDHGSYSRGLLERFRSSEYFDLVRHVATEEELAACLDSGETKMGIQFPPDFTRALAKGRRSTLQLLVDGSDSNASSLSMSYARGVIQDFSVRQVMGLESEDQFIPIDVRPRVWYNPDLEQVNYMVPGIIGVLLLQLTIVVTAMAVVKEKELGTIEQLMVSPIRPFEFILGKTVPYAFLCWLDMLLILALSYVLFGVTVKGSLGLLLSLATLFLCSGLGLGLLVSTVSDTQQEAILTSIFIYLPSILLSGFIFPIESMPFPIQLITFIIPLRYFLVILRGVIVKGIGIGYLWRESGVLLIFTALSLGLAARAFRKTMQ